MYTACGCLLVLSSPSLLYVWPSTVWSCSPCNLPVSLWLPPPMSKNTGYNYLSSHLKVRASSPRQNQQSQMKERQFIEQGTCVEVQMFSISLVSHDRQTEDASSTSSGVLYILMAILTQYFHQNAVPTG